MNKMQMNKILPSADPRKGKGGKLMSLSRFVKIAAVSLLVASCGVAEKQTLPSDIIQKLTAVLEQVSEEKGVVGYAVAILKDGELVYSHAGGLANIELDVPADTGQVYAIYSITKLFIITALYELVEEGKVDLDAAMATYLPALPQHWQHITVRQILSHQSGLPEYWADWRDMPLLGKDLLPSLADKPMVYELGSRSQYNQTNFYLIGRIIETITGQELTEVIEERMIKRFDLTDTKFGGSDAFIPNRVSSYVIDQSGAPLKPNEFPFLTYHYASAGLNTSLQDLSKWFKLLIDGTMISQETLYQSWQPLTYNDGKEAAYANGWESRSDGDIRIVGHYGGGRTNVRHYFDKDNPGSSVTIIHFSNGTKFFYNLSDVSNDLVGILSPKLIGPGGQLSKKISKAIQANDWSAIEAHYVAFRQDPTTQHISTEGVINRLGYEGLFQTSTIEIAVKLFELNVRDFPESANVYDSMGDGYFAARHYEKARVNYQKAFEMAPDIYTHVPQRLAEIKAKLDNFDG